MRTSTTVNQKGSSLLSKMLPLVMHEKCGGKASRMEEVKPVEKMSPLLWYLKHQPALVFYQSLNPGTPDWLLFSKASLSHRLCGDIQPCNCHIRASSKSCSEDSCFALLTQCCLLQF